MHLVDGTYRKDRHEGKESIDPPKGRPTPPKALGPEEQAEWDRMCDRLDEAGTLARVDDAALYQCVQLFAEGEALREEDTRIRDLSKKLTTEAKRLEGAELLAAITEIVKLQLITSKHQTQLRQGHMALRQWYVEFGLTPSARTRVQPIGDKPKRDVKKEKYFGRGA